MSDKNTFESIKEFTGDAIGFAICFAIVAGIFWLYFQMLKLLWKGVVSIYNMIAKKASA